MYLNLDNDCRNALQRIHDFNDQLMREGKLYIPPKNKPQEIIIKPELLDISNIQEGEANNKLYRPKTFNEYIGQQEAKEKILYNIDGCKKYGDNFSHTIITGSSGTGKTTLALIIANLLQKKLVLCTAGEIKTEQQMADKIGEAKGGIIFLDEAHRISTKIGTFLLPILEDFQIQGKQMKYPFVMIFSTTHLGNISKNLEALVQRFSLQLNLNEYSKEELIQILKQYKEKKYPSVNIDDAIYYNIATNCRITPRIALSLLKEYIYTFDWPKVMKNNGIVQEGITINDIKVLKYLNDLGGAGKNNIAKFLRIENNTYEYQIEPYLIYKEFIIIGSKRKITEKGKEFLQTI